MVEVPTEQTAKLHIITHLDWEREGQDTFDRQRALLLDILAQLLDHMQSDDTAKIDHFLLGGQTIILDDIAHVRPDLLTSLVIYNAGGRLGIGPWYIQMDGLLTDGEVMIRNLLLGRADTQRYGVQWMTVAYLPKICQHTAQLPQILRGFDIDSIFMCLGQPVMPLPFQWEASDGSHILAMNHQQIDDVAQTIAKQRDGQPDGPFLWMHAVNRSDKIALSNLGFNLSVTAQQSNLSDYVANLRSMLPDDLRATLKGEVHMQQHTPISGRFSARIAQKQENSRLQAELSLLAEPLLALANVYGNVTFPQNQRALLEHSWRLLLQNQAHYAMAGAVSDDVQSEMTIRSRRIADNSQRVIQSALQGLSGTPFDKQRTLPNTSTETYIVVWNPHGHQVTQVVELDLHIPDSLHPSLLTTPSGDEIPFSWNGDDRRFGFRANVPSVGYVTYTLKLSQEKTAAYHRKRVVAGRAIGSASGESLELNNGRLDWMSHHSHITDLLSFHDGGDAGDVWHYVEPQPDFIMRGNIVGVVQVEATPTYERLIFRHRMRIASSLINGKSRQRGLKVLDITTTATYYTDLPGIHFHTQFSNNALDHRLRAHIRTGIETDAVYTDSAFDVIRRPIPEKDAGSQPMHSVTAVYNRFHGIGLFTRGLPEFEPIYEDQQITLGLTLLRAVGWLDKKAAIETRGAQAQGTCHAEFMLMPLDGIRNHARTLRISQEYRAPLRAVQYTEKPAVAEKSYLEIDDDRIVITALKPPQAGDGLIVRLLNPSVGDIGVNIHAEGKIKKASRVNMAETHKADYKSEGGQVNVRLEPHQVVTIRLEYE
ncbi:MAG: glycosyl hydrolase-related protein [Anaerolineae bacterium]|nr:glycosyl hydrolase-related protein [Anaerolineae bacterium]MDQ7034252.1 glycosyl hydrolase-related protein [Anaerolineae bacterium]